MVVPVVPVVVPVVVPCGGTSATRRDATYSTLLYPSGARRAVGFGAMTPGPSRESSVPGGERSQRSGGGCPTVLGLTTGGCQVRRDPR